MASVTLTTLRARVRHLADMDATTFVTDAATSLDAFINTGVQKLHDKILDAMGDDFLGETSSAYTIVITAGAGNSTITGSTPLPADFFRLTGLDLNFNGTLIDLARYAQKERNARRAQGGLGPSGVPKYRLTGNTLQFTGQDGTYTGTLHYAPAPTVLSGGVDAINYPNGWEHYAILYAAILCGAKEETDVSVLMGLLQMEEARIDAAAGKRDSANPPQMSDVERSFTNSDAWWEY